MPEQPTSAPSTSRREEVGQASQWRRLEARVLRRPAATTAVVLVFVSTLFVLLTGMRPTYDPYGWLVWGRQALHLNLNTDGAPSWKPLTFLFTFPYALAGRGQLGLWMITAVAGALAGTVFAARIAYRLTGPCPDCRYAPIAAAAFAGLGVLGINGYWALILAANSDPMVVALCLAAIDAHLCKRPAAALVLLTLASLGRPEVWPFLGLYAVWIWRAVPRLRVSAAAALAVVPALSFIVPALTSKSWMSAADLDLRSINTLHGDKIVGVIGRMLGLYEAPMWIAVLIALALAVRRRDRTVLLLATASLTWVIVEIALALHGFTAVARYLIEPAAVLVVIAATGVGWVLAAASRASDRLRWAGAIVVAALLAALAPSARLRVRVVRAQIIAARVTATKVDRLHEVIVRDGGARRIRACGQPVTMIGFQSTLAWEVGLNVGNIGYNPGAAIRRGQPTVLFEPYRNGWKVRPIHTTASCRNLTAATAF